MVLILIAFNALISASAQIILKLGVNRLGVFTPDKIVDFFFKAALSPYILGGTALYVFSLGLWLVILSKANVSYAYPIMGMSYIFGILLAVLILHEKANGWQWIGAGIIIVGIFFVTKN